MPVPQLPRYVTLRSATLLVIANIIGAGVFTTAGFQAADLGHPVLILGLWLLGGALALAGALAYAELGAAMPEAGGEYVYLRETYGPALGFMTAFVSLVAGFSAPIASALKSLVRYLCSTFDWTPPRVAALGGEELLAIAAGWLLVAVHARCRRGSFGFNDLVTLLKVAGIVAVLVLAFAIGRGSLAHLAAPAPRFAALSLPDRLAALATSLVFVSFCYTGWNAAAYIAGEMKAPQRDLPRALLLGTTIVTVLYLGLNTMYFYGAPVSQLEGVVEVGLVSGRHLFGDTGSTLFALVLVVSIFASASAMTLAGARVYWAFARDFPPFAALARTGRRGGAPTRALVLQGAVTSALIVSGRVDQIQQYAGLVLGLFSSLAVACVLVLRRTRPDLPRPFRMIGYPWLPLLFLAISGWTMVWAWRGRPWESTLALLTVAVAGLLFAVVRSRPRPVAG